MTLNLTVDLKGNVLTLSPTCPEMTPGQHISRLFQVSSAYNGLELAAWFDILLSRKGMDTAITLVDQQSPSCLVINHDPANCQQYLATITELAAIQSKQVTGPDNFISLFENSESCFYFRAINGQLQTVIGSMTARPQVPEPVQPGQSVFDFYTPEALKNLLDADAQMVRTGKPLETEDTITELTGKRVFHSAKTPLHDGQGKLLGISGLTHDITDYQQDIEQLNINQARATQSIMSSSLAVLTFRLADKTILSANESFLQDFGYSRHSIIGHSPAEICLIDLRSQNQLEQLVIRDGEIAGFKTVLHTKSGAPIDAEINAFVMDIDNEPCLIGLFLNQSRAETAESRLRIIADASFEGIALHVDGIIMEVNRAGCEILGRSREQVIGQNALDMVPKEHHSAIFQTWEGDLHGSYELDFTRPDQSLRTILLRSHEVIESGQPHRVVAFQDITEEKKLKTQLQRTQKMEILGQLTGGIAHDFNNILASILGFSDLLMERLSKDEPINQEKLLHWTSQVNKSGLRGRDLVRQMLSFSRGGNAQAIATELSAPVKEVLAMVQASLALNITAEAVIEPTPRVLIDPTQLNQVLLNLCINASHAIDDKGGTISVSVSQQTFPKQRCTSCQTSFVGDYVVVAISDTGSGINPGNFQKIFEPFFTTKGVNQGTGMGLSMIHGIVHDFQGHVIVESEQNSGSTFSVLLPPQHEQNLNDDPINVDGKTVVLVDDDELVADMVYRVLKDQGYQVKSFNCPLAALDEFNSDGDQWDLLITDQRMPKLTGEQLIQKIHRKRRNLPVILHTGYSDAVDQSDSSATWVMLEKPVEQHLLLNTINDLLTAAPAL